MFPEAKRGNPCRSWNARFSGREALASSSGSHGYLDGAINARGVLAHRVIWAMTYGYWPIGIDHVNGDRRDNRIANLREATQAENMRNTKTRCDNKCGIAGVWQLRRSGMWRARIKRDGISVDLGTFPSKDLAAAARDDAARKYGFHPNHGRAE